MYYVYILKNPEGILYKGSTRYLSFRIDQHNGESWYPSYTKGKGPWELVYFEKFETRTDALKREKFFKTGKGRAFLKSVIKS